MPGNGLISILGDIMNGISFASFRIQFSAFQSRHRMCPIKKLFQKFRNIHRKTPVLESPTQVLSCESCENFKNTYFGEDLRTAVSDYIN